MLWHLHNQLPLEVKSDEWRKELDGNFVWKLLICEWTPLVLSLLFDDLSSFTTLNGILLPLEEFAGYSFFEFRSQWASATWNCSGSCVTNVKSRQTLIEAITKFDTRSGAALAICEIFARSSSASSLEFRPCRRRRTEIPTFVVVYIWFLICISQSASGGIALMERN